MRQVKARLPKKTSASGDGALPDILIDSPPGVSCPAVNAVMDADCVVLVTEPTPFGLHDLRLAVEAFGPLGMPLGVVINRAGVGDDTVRDYCREAGVPIWAEIPFSREVAGAYARGEVVARAVPAVRAVALALMASMRAAAEAYREARHA